MGDAEAGNAEATDALLREILLRAAARPPGGMIHPVIRGERVYHCNQEWAATVPGGTAVVAEHYGPDHRGEWEYEVVAAEDFARRPGPDNPLVRVVRWPGWALRQRSEDSLAPSDLSPQEIVWRLLGPLPHEERAMTADQLAAARKELEPHVWMFVGLREFEEGEGPRGNGPVA